MVNLITTLTFLACLSGSEPTQLSDCHKVSVPWDGSPLQCELYGQMEMQKWLAENPPRVRAPGRDGGYKCVTEPSGLLGSAA